MDAASEFTALKDGVLFIVALYGAVLSTFNWRQAVKREQRQITVSATMTAPVYDGGAVGGDLRQT